MPESTVIKVVRDGTLTLSDFGGGHTYEIAYEDGNLVANHPGEVVNNFLDRNRIGATPSLRFGADQPMSLSFTANLRDITDAAWTTLPEFLLRTGNVGTNWISTLGATAEVPVYTMTWDTEGTSHGDPTDHQVVYPYCYLSGTISEGDPSTIAITITSYAVRPSSAT